MRRNLLLFLIVSVFVYFSKADTNFQQNEAATIEDNSDNGDGKLTDFMDPFYGFLGFRTKREAQHQEPIRDQNQNQPEQTGRLRVQLKFDEKTKKVIIQDARIENNRAKRYANPHDTGRDHTHSAHSDHDSHSSEESSHTRAKRDDEILLSLNITESDIESGTTTNRTKKPDSSSSSSSSEEKKNQRPKRSPSPGRGSSNSQSNSQKRRQENRQQERVGAHGHDQPKKEEKKESSEEKTTTTVAAPSTTTIRRYRLKRSLDDDDDDDDRNDEEINVLATDNDHNHDDDDNDHDRRKRARAGVIQASFSRTEQAGEPESYAIEKNTRQQQYGRRNNHQMA
jgi:hypothetical protein